MTFIFLRIRTLDYPREMGRISMNEWGWTPKLRKIYKIVKKIINTYNEGK